MSSHQNRWIFESTIEPSDKVRLRGFIKNEIAYYNALLNGFQSRLRTMPEVFDEVDGALLGAVAAHGYNLSAFDNAEILPATLKPYAKILFDAQGHPALSERVMLFIASVSVSTVLHPATREAMVLAFLEEHRRQAASLSRTVNNREDQVLASAVSLLHPHDGRLKRHLQLPARAAVIGADRRSIRSSYTASPIMLKQTIPDNATFNVIVVRDEEGAGEGNWMVELRHDPNDYMVRLSDSPIKKFRKTRQPAR